jgi:NACHT domain
MPEPITIVALSAYVAKNAPSWLASLGGTILDKGQGPLIGKGEDFTISRGKSLTRRIFHLDEKEQLRHLEQALKNATERGFVTFDTLPERDLYKEILDTLSLPGPMGETLRHEIMQLFTLAETPDLAVLTDTYNRRQRFSNAAYQDIDAGPYLNSFFTALLGELYADPYFRAQLSEVLQLRAARSMQQSLLDIVTLLERIGVTLEDSYSALDFAHDVDVYTAYIERTLHNLRIVGVVSKDQNADPELSGIFVPLRIRLNEQGTNANRQPDAIVSALEQYPCMVLLGGPGSGKSTVTKYLAWSHAVASQSTSILAHIPLLSGNPLPLRIELRRLSEERKRTNYDFLSFATEVLLKRDGIDINPQMFKELLTRRCMLLLFDGLDEVATLEERLGLVNEIEHFALCYPGNPVLVTSRPVGYELARISHQLFSHAEIQKFNDDQIKQFLENWYTAVLRLSAIPQREQEELNVLLTTLKENPRLHKLAENPLLLTVITALHRYERLPDRRVQVYDRCADLLLETWARLKGTDKRWKDMKMVKEDQYACVAYLGFVLHERSQEETSGDNRKAEDTTVDVSSRFLRKNVEDFLRKQKLIDGLAEQRAEATRFIALVQEEAGLIVERGTDENGEALYSFVHRTFQEYFAAADIYERYQQKEDPKIISKFLVEHLHDPHWEEVTFLLLGKLKSTPVTNQLRQLLTGKTKSKRSQGTEILQQDLFFVCDCLIDEIKVENSLVETVKSSLSDVVKSSLFREQRQKALEYLGKLMQTRQYNGQGRQELIALASKDDTLNVTTKLEAAQNLYLYSSTLPEERQSASRILTFLLQRPDLSIDQTRQCAESLYRYRAAGSQARQLATSMLTSLLQRPDLSIDQTCQSAVSLYQSSLAGSEAQLLATSILLSLLSHGNITDNQDEVYSILSTMVPQFHRLPPIDARS